MVIGSMRRASARGSRVVLACALSLAMGTACGDSASHAPDASRADVALGQDVEGHDTTPASDTSNDADMTGPPIGVLAVFAPPATGPIPFEAMPFPSDARLDSTGHISLPALPGASAGAPAEANILGALAEMTGFGVTTATFLPFALPVDATSVPTSGPTGDRGLTMASTVIMLDLDAMPVARVPLKVAVREVDNLHFVVAQHDVGHSLGYQRRYGVVVTTSAKAMGGMPLLPSATVTQALGSTPITSNAALEKTRMTLQPLVAALPSQGLDVTQIASATVFTTQDPTEQLYALRTQLGMATPPTATILQRVDGSNKPSLYTAAELDAYMGTPAMDLPGRDNASTTMGQTAIIHSHIAYVINGSFPSPYFLNTDLTRAGLIETDAGGFKVKGMSAVQFSLALPKCPGMSGCSYDTLRVAVFVHGLGDTRATAMMVADSLAAKGIATIGADQPFHGSRSPAAQDMYNNFTGVMGAGDNIGDGGSSVPILELATLNSTDPTITLNPRALGDSFRQGHIDIMQQALLLTNPTAFDSIKALDAGLSTLSFDASSLVLTGESFGGIHCPPAAAVGPEYGAAIFDVASGNFLPYAIGYSYYYGPIFYGMLRTGLGIPEDDANVNNMDPGRLPEFHPTLQLMQQAMEHGDPQSYARRLTQEPAMGQKAKHVLQLSVHNDERGPNIGNEELGRALGLSFALGSQTNTMPLYSDMPTIATPATGISGNGAGGLTLVFQQWRPATNIFLSTQNDIQNFTDDAVFPPFTPNPKALAMPATIANPIVKVQNVYSTFIDSFYKTGTPTVIDPM